MTYSSMDICRLHIQGKSCDEVANELGCTAKTARNHLRRIEKGPQEKSGSKRGRPEVLSATAKRAMAREARKERRTPLGELSNSYQVCKNTARRALKEAGISKRRAVKKPLLNKEQIKKRLEWCLERKDWSDRQWDRVLWSDEAMIRIGQDANVQWVFRKPSEKYDPSCLQISFKNDRQGVMVWGLFSTKHRSRLFCFDKGAIDSKIYQSVLQEGLLGAIEAEEGWLETQLRPSSLIFQQDNAPIHNSASTRQFLKSNNISPMPWPANSPDLNPIENIWKVMKERFHKRWLTLRAERKGKVGLEEVKKVLADTWEAIEQGEMRNLVRSMPRRVAAVIKARGGHVKY